MYPTEQLGYPGWVLPLGALIGLVLFFANGRLLFYLSLFFLLTTDGPAYSYARLSITGPFNLLDLLSLLCLAGALRVSRRGLFRLPTEAWAAVAVLAFGALYTLAKIGPVYDAMRAVRFAAPLPLFIYVGYHAISGSREARTFVWIVAVACFVQSLRQIAFVSSSPPTDNPIEWRTIRYLNATFLTVPLALLLSRLASRRTVRAWLWIAVGVGGVAVLLTQTRSYWIAQAVACLWLVFERARRRSLVRAFAVLLFIVLALSGALVALREGGVLTVSPTDVFLTGRSTDFSSGTGREDAVLMELRDYWHGNPLEWLLGLGLGYFGGPQSDPQVAWGHVGYVTYLSNLGLAGLFTLGFLLPWRAFVRGLELSRSGDPAKRAFGWLCCILLVSMVSCSITSSGLLVAAVYGPVLIVIGGAASLRGQAASPAPAPSASSDALSNVRLWHGVAPTGRWPA